MLIYKISIETHWTLMWEYEYILGFYVNVQTQDIFLNDLYQTLSLH